MRHCLPPKPWCLARRPRDATAYRTYNDIHEYCCAWLCSLHSHRLSVSENGGGVRGMFGARPKRHGVRRGWRESHNKELNDFTPRNFLRTIKARRMQRRVTQQE
jgi:hypothetical protein